MGHLNSPAFGGLGPDGTHPVNYCSSHGGWTPRCSEADRGGSTIRLVIIDTTRVAPDIRGAGRCSGLAVVPVKPATRSPMRFVVALALSAVLVAGCGTATPGDPAGGSRMPVPTDEAVASQGASTTPSQGSADSRNLTYVAFGDRGHSAPIATVVPRFPHSMPRVWRRRPDDRSTSSTSPRMADRLHLSSPISSRRRPSATRSPQPTS